MSRSHEPFHRITRHQPKDRRRRGERRRFRSRRLEALEPRLLLARGVRGEVTDERVQILDDFLASLGDSAPLVAEVDGVGDGSFTPAVGPAETTVTDYYDGRSGAMALSYDTEMYLCGMIHSQGDGYNPDSAAIRAQKTRDGWPHIIQDGESYDIPVSFNICGIDSVFGDSGPSEYAELDIFHPWHPDPHWSTNTWYSDAPPNGGDYKTVGELSGTTRTYDLIYAGDLTEQTMNSDVPFEISYHNFGHESLSQSDAETIDAAMRLGVEYHKRMGSKLTAQGPPWNNNPQPEKYPLYGKNGLFVLNRKEGASREPYEVVEDLWIVARADPFNANTDMTAWIDDAIANGHVLSPYSHAEDGFESTNRAGYQNSLAYAQSKVDSGELWATTLSEVGRYWEAKSDVSAATQIVDGKTVVDISLTDYDATTFGIPYLTFTSPMPDASQHAKITVDYPVSRTLNSDSDTVRVVNGTAIYTIYLNPNGATHVEIEGVAQPFTGGVDINEPTLSIDTTAPVNPPAGTPITIQATTNSTDEIYSVNLIYQRNDDAKVAVIMTENGGAWESTIGPFAQGDEVTYYASVTDNSGRRERSATEVVGVLDGVPPVWRSQGQSSANPAFGGPVELFAEGKDNVRLRFARLETNETGVWQERSEHGSPTDMGDTANEWTRSTFYWSNPDVPGGTTVSWRIRYEDTDGNQTVTNTMSFQVGLPPVDNQPPQYSDPSVQMKRLGEPATFSLRWQENEDLAGYTFSFDDGGGTFVDSPFTPFTEHIAESWWDTDWDFRRDIAIDNSGNPQALTDHTVLVTIDTTGPIGAGNMNRHGGDIRFVDGSDELDFWVESGLNTAATRIWVKVPSIAASSTKQISMYYGNRNRTVPRSNGAKTFPVFDDFGGRGWEEFKFSGNPTRGPSQPSGPGTFSSVLREDDGTWKMYSSFDQDDREIALATSDDGIHWDRVGVVLRRGPVGEWDSGINWAPIVFKEDGVYYMLHPADGPLGIQMGLATSLDGVNWSKYDDPSTTEAPFALSDPVFNDPVWATGDTESPCFGVVHENGTYYVMYDTLRSRRQASFASSTDLINWTPVYEDPRFPGGPTLESWNFHTFCGNTFEFEDEFYLVLPGQDVSRNYGKLGLYVSSSPEFPENDTEFLGMVMVGDPNLEWENEDMDTPWAVQFDNKMYMYYAACGDCHTQTGMALINDVGLALSQAYPAGNYIGLDRSITPSHSIMPPVGWENSIGGFLERNDQNFEITLDPAVTGRAVVQNDGDATRSLKLSKDIPSMNQGVVSAWMRSSNNNTGDYDLYVDGDSQSTLAIVAGLGGNGNFHYWNGSFVDTNVAYAADTWYRVEIEFDVASNTYNFAVYDTSFAELLRVSGIQFGGQISSGIDRINARSSSSFIGTAYLDDAVVRSSTIAPEVNVGAESSQTSNAWARTQTIVPFTLGATVRWKYTAVDVNGNQTESEVFELPFIPAPLLDTPPAVTFASPTSGFVSNVSTVEFHAICSDERDVSEVSLIGNWSGSNPVATVSGPGINGVDVVFNETVPNGVWSWSVQCVDSASNTITSPGRTLIVSASGGPVVASSAESTTEPLNLNGVLAASVYHQSPDPHTMEYVQTVPAAELNPSVIVEPSEGAVRQPTDDLLQSMQQAFSDLPESLLFHGLKALMGKADWTDTKLNSMIGSALDEEV